MSFSEEFWKEPENQNNKLCKSTALDKVLKTPNNVTISRLQALCQHVAKTLKTGFREKHIGKISNPEEFSLFLLSLKTSGLSN